MFIYGNSRINSSRSNLKKTNIEAKIQNDECKKQRNNSQMNKTENNIV